MLHPQKIDATLPLGVCGLAAVVGGLWSFAPGLGIAALGIAVIAVSVWVHLSNHLAEEAEAAKRQQEQANRNGG